MKIHYIYSQLHHVAACGQDSKLNYIQVTTDASEITCMSCVRCLEGYTQRISDIRVKYENTSIEALLVNLIAMSSEDEYDNDGYPMTRYWYGEMCELFFVLIEKLKAAGVVEDVEWMSRATLDLL